jgi:hypothetical protein
MWLSLEGYCTNWVDRKKIQVVAKLARSSQDHWSRTRQLVFGGIDEGQSTTRVIIADSSWSTHVRHHWGLPAYTPLLGDIPVAYNIVRHG